MSSLFIGPPPANPYAYDTGLFQGPPEASASSTSSAGQDAAGGFLAVAGSLSQVLGSYFQIAATRDQAKAQAMDLEFEGWASRQNARMAEQQAHAALEAGKRDVALATMQAGQEIAATEASFGGRGIVEGVGSAAEQVASQRLVRDLDVLSLSVNAVRQANAARTAGLNSSMRGAFAELSGRNLRRTAGSLSPLMGGATTLLGSASQIADGYYTPRRLRSRSDTGDY